MVAKTFATLIGTTVIAAAITAFSFHVSADQVPAPGMVACADPFGREYTRADLVRAFGAANVVDQEIEIMGIKPWSATVIYPNDSQRRLEFIFTGEVHPRLMLIRISKESQWTSWRNVHIGMSLEEVEVLNGKAFKLRNLKTITDGITISVAITWQGGAMERIAGRCQLLVHFKPDDDAPSDAFTELVGDLVSSDPKVRSLRLTVSEILIDYQVGVP